MLHLSYCFFLFFLSTPRPPKSKPTDTLFPSATLFRSFSLSGRSSVIKATLSDTSSATSDMSDLQDVAAEPARDVVADIEAEILHWRVVAVPERRSEEHTSELQSLMRISYAVFCLKKQIHTTLTKEKLRCTTLLDN